MRSQRASFRRSVDLTLQRFVLLDRDGTIIVERNYLSEPDQIELIPRVAHALRRLSEMGMGLVSITNQSGIGRGYFDRNRLDLIHQRLIQMLEAEGVRLNGIYYCPHLPEDDCRCRKPRTALVEQAAEQLHFDPSASFVIGDKECDIELGGRIGAFTILVRTGYGSQFVQTRAAKPNSVVEDLWEAVPIIERLIKEE